jgi:hypothetical protein
MIIYVVTNNINSLRYVGYASQTLVKRKGEHKKSINRGDSSHFYRAIRKYGFENFIWEIIDSATNLGDLKKKEIYWIKKLNTYKGPGYNMTPGGDGRSGYIATEETRRKLRGKRPQFSGKNHPMFGKFGADNPTYGSKRTDEQKKRMSESTIGKRSGKNNPMYGKHHTEESREEMRRNRPDNSGKKHYLYNKRGKDCPNYGKRRTNSQKRKVSGGECYRAKLTWKIVEQIREEYAYGEITPRKLAQKYKVTPQTIGRVLGNKIWVI